MLEDDLETGRVASMDASEGTGEGPGPDIAPILTPRIDIAVFSESAALTEAGHALKADRRMRRARLEIHDGAMATAIAHYKTNRTPNLIVVEAPADEALLFEGLSALSEECLQSTKVIVVGQRNDIKLYRDLIDFGVGEYVAHPLDSISLLSAIGRLYRSETRHALGKVFAFFGARGGVGSSTLAHNTAWSLATDQQKDVLLVDMDLSFGTSGLDFNLSPPAGVADALAEAAKLDEARLERMVAKKGERLGILAPPLTMDGDFDLAGERLEHLIGTARKAAQIVVLDLPHTWAPWVRELLLESDEIVVTAAPDLANMRNFKKVSEYLSNSRPNDRPTRLVLNQIGLPKRPEIKIDDFTRAVGCKAEMELAYDGVLFGRAANNGQMLAETGRKVPSARLIADFADRLANGSAVKAKKAASSPLTRLFKRAG
ncbi:AAA family ATPase [Fulvimarina sp. MAC8]|uniref:AAA family ATPase n=1 Tax=Fulvimarina sp. MAC8 TaxID=3162874 RepID=UPI0032EF1505